MPFFLNLDHVHTIFSGLLLPAVLYKGADRLRMSAIVSAQCQLARHNSLTDSIQCGIASRDPSSAKSINHEGSNSIVLNRGSVH